ncbi:hypothetical protein UK23_02055 [Lentzea aerocolonigenes]|uniref:Uncharacterized protein n=1 Tax=Lentzea aerocolonigenes TaxID=68170 RepID=A0A0F0HDN7_LENAE|nr:hypothetical protein [Lentzea aerocolonigenes]KJK52961.1 hypothetical protein UK23_02055 [Lentzea aerocolonigenes]
MAGGGVRALLLRTAALGGLTAAAWLLGGTDASASPEEPPAVETAVETPQLMEDPAGWAKALTDRMLDRHQAQRLVPPVAKPHDEEPADEDAGPVLDYTSGSQGNTRYGTVTNQAPPEVVKAKAQVRAAKIAAAKAAAEATLTPPPAPKIVPVKKIEPKLPDLPVPAPAKTEPVQTHDLNWTTPGQNAPLPAPQQAPVVATASASSGHTDNSGGTRGVLAVLTSHNSLFPPTTWSVEQRRDGRSPGSLEGLPSTSPD